MTTARSRRDVLRWLLGLGVSASLASVLSGCRIDDPGLRVKPPLPGPRYRGEQPNVVLVLVDDLAAEIMGESSRFPFVQTPHVARLGREGVTCDAAFVPTAVCSPSRASLLYG